MQDALSIYTVYFNTTDFPGLFVARRFEAWPGMVNATKDHHAADDIEAVRGWIREHSIGRGFLADVCMGRQPMDDPPIVESWM